MGAVTDLHGGFSATDGQRSCRLHRLGAGSWRSDGRSPLIQASHEPLAPTWSDVDRLAGVNLIGYVSSDSGLGDFTRRIHSALDAAQVPTVPHYHRTASPTAADVPPLTTELLYDTNLITVHADQMVQFEADHGAQVFGDRASIGFWFWELSHLPPRIVANVAMVDEVWAATEFIADAFRAVTDKPVEVVHVPVPEPQVAARSREPAGLPDGRFVFLVTLDHQHHRSQEPARLDPRVRTGVPDPVGRWPGSGGEDLEQSTTLVRTRAAPGSGGGSPRHHGHRSARVAGRADGVDLTQRLPGFAAPVRRSRAASDGGDVAGIPVIATRYSGNLEFMTDENSVLIDFELIP